MSLVLSPGKDVQMTQKVPPTLRRCERRSLLAATLAALVCPLLTLGCTGGNDTGDDVVGVVQPPIDEKKAIAIALKYAAKRNGRSLRELEAARVTNVRSVWLVTVSTLPHAPGRFATYRIDEKGNIEVWDRGE
jgi:hypothetical protein